MSDDVIKVGYPTCTERLNELRAIMRDIQDEVNKLEIEAAELLREICRKYPNENA